MSGYVLLYILYIQISISMIFGRKTKGRKFRNGFLNSHLPSECGISRCDTKRRIIKGDKAGLGHFPWMALIGIEKKQKKPEFFCGGSLINRYYVISAAHCEDDGNIVRLGENDLKTDVDCRGKSCAPPHQDIKIKGFKFHEEYDDDSNENDIALIELSEAAEFNEFVQPICLVNKPLSHLTLMKRMVYLPGWGSIHPTEMKPSTSLMYIAAPVVSSAKCNLLFGVKLTARQLCIGYDTGKDTCSGDSGGPASFKSMIGGRERSVLVGIVSYGSIVCGIAPGVYTDATYYLDWILSNIVKG